MLQKTYSIYSDDLHDAQLFVESGKSHLACWCKKKDDDKLQAFESFQCDNVTADNFEELIDNAKLFSRLLTMPAAGTNFFWNTSEVLCVPKEKSDAAFLQQNFELLAGSLPNSTIASEATAECRVAWRIEDLKQKIAAQCFPGAVFMHQYIGLLPALQHSDESVIYLFFYPQHFTLAAFKNNKLHYINTMKYAAPADVLYFVLNVCKQYEIANDVVVFCSGFIDEKSKLYETLYQYLEGFQLLNANEAQLTTDEFRQHSLHYYVPYINYVV